MFELHNFVRPMELGGVTFFEVHVQEDNFKMLQLLP